MNVRRQLEEESRKIVSVKPQQREWMGAVGAVQQSSTWAHPNSASPHVIWHWGPISASNEWWSVEDPLIAASSRLSCLPQASPHRNRNSFAPLAGHYCLFTACNWSIIQVNTSAKEVQPCLGWRMWITTWGCLAYYLHSSSLWLCSWMRPKLSKQKITKVHVLSIWSRSSLTCDLAHG